MRLSCEKGLLLDGLNLVSRAVSARTTKPILECVLLSTRDDLGLVLCGNDTELCITSSLIEAEVERRGGIALHAKLFTDIVRKMPGDVVSIDVDEKGVTEVTGGRAVMRIYGLPAEEFPVIAERELADSPAQYTLSAALLRDMIRQTIFSVSLDQSKLILTGELFDIKEGVLQIVSLDMHRISYRSHKFLGEDTTARDHNAVIPARALHELSRALSGEEDETEVVFYFTDKRVVFDTPGYRFVSRLLEGDFIRYGQIFNEDFNLLMIVDRVLLLNSLERTLLVAGESKHIPIKMDIHDDVLQVSAQTAERGQSHDEIPCETNGQDLVIYFNPKYLIDALRVIEEENVQIKFTGPKSACTIRGAKPEDETNHDDQKYLIVPLRGPA